MFLEYPEITPPVNTTHFAKCDAESPGGILRSLIEGKIASLKINALKAGIITFDRIVVVGGGASNPVILQIIADIFQKDLYVSKHE